MVSMDNTDAPLTAALPASSTTEKATGHLSTASPSTGRVLDLIALVILITLSTLVFTVAGPAAFTAVTSVGIGLFATWRSSHSRSRSRSPRR
jgi:hypothetical protein